MSGIHLLVATQPGMGHVMRSRELGYALGPYCSAVHHVDTPEQARCLLADLAGRWVVDVPVEWGVQPPIGSVWLDSTHTARYYCPQVHGEYAIVRQGVKEAVDSMERLSDPSLIGLCLGGIAAKGPYAQLVHTAVDYYRGKGLTVWTPHPWAQCETGTFMADWEGCLARCRYLAVGGGTTLCEGLYKRAPHRIDVWPKTPGEIRDTHKAGWRPTGALGRYSYAGAEVPASWCDGNGAQRLAAAICRHWQIPGK